jgi:hypothetical protein
MPYLIPFRNKFSAIWAVSRNFIEVRVHLQKPKKTIYKKIVGHPGIYGPPCDCGFCGGGGCYRCG